MPGIMGRLPRMYHAGRDVSRQEGTTSQSRLLVEDPMAANAQAADISPRSPLNEAGGPPFPASRRQSRCLPEHLRPAASRLSGCPMHA